MVKKLISPLVLVALLLAACSPQPNLDLANCRDPDHRPVCRPRLEWVSLPAPTGKMQLLYEDDRAMVFVNPDHPTAVRLLSVPRIFRRFEKDEIGQIWSLASMGHVAGYDKSLKSCVALVGVIYGPVGLDDPDRQFGRVLDAAGLYLPDCTPILQWVGDGIII